MPTLNERVRELRCVICDRRYAPTADRLVCDVEGLEGILDVEYDWTDVPTGDALRSALSERSHNIWRYAELLPCRPTEPADFLEVGCTPIYPAPKLAEQLGLLHLLLKDDGLNPTGSFKDRASAVAVVMAQAQGHRRVACASTGNAASSLAGMAAHTGLESVILVPAAAPAPKVAQLRMFGARVLRVDADYSRVWDLCQRLIDAEGWYNRNCAVNPYLVEGKKTAGLEIGEQLAGQHVDWVAVSVGDGCTIAGIAKGLRHMVKLGVLPAMPRMLGVQAEGAAAVYRAWKGLPAQAQANTLADSISVSAPRNRFKAVHAVRQSDGAIVTVTDDAIRRAMTLLPRTTGVFAEPAAAATVAGLRCAVEEGIVAEQDVVVAVLTGNGLKDIAAAQAVAGEPPTVAPTLDAIQAELALAEPGEEE